LTIETERASPPGQSAVQEGGQFIEYFQFFKFRFLETLKNPASSCGIREFTFFSKLCINCKRRSPHVGKFLTEHMARRSKSK
jgi:hypothetical protein